MEDDYEDKIRVETFIQIKQKVEEITDIVKDNGLEGDFMACYCFALLRPMSEDMDGHSQVEHMSGFHAESPTEIHTMTQAMVQDYFMSIGEKRDTSSLDYWLDDNK